MDNTGSIVLDYNAIINVIPKPWLDWITAKFRSVSRQSVIWITEVYNHIYRRSSLDFYRPLTVLSQQNKSHVHKKSVYTVIVLIKMRI